MNLLLISKLELHMHISYKLSINVSYKSLKIAGIDIFES